MEMMSELFPRKVESRDKDMTVFCKEIRAWGEGGERADRQSLERREMLWSFGNTYIICAKAAEDVREQEGVR